MVIIAGGSGTRLWPLSTPEYPKHLLSVGAERTLLQSAYDRATQLSRRVYVIPEVGHWRHVKQQLPDLKKSSFVVEPARRGTANCVAAALAHIRRHEKDFTEPIAFMAADHYIRNTSGFVHSFHIAEAVSRQGQHLVLIGVEPEYPATGFGYIEKDSVYNEQSFVYRVKSFTEKPDYANAQKYLASGNYLWNCSYFVGSLRAFEAAMEAHAKVLYANYQRLLAAKNVKAYTNIYLSLTSDTIDYALIEHVPDLLVVPATFDWLDLGSYSDLHKAVARDEAGNFIMGDRVYADDVENSFMANQSDQPLAVIGLDNVAVVSTPHGVLVTRKDLAQKVGDISKRIMGRP